MTDKPIPIAGWTARDIASHYTYSASRVQMHVVDEDTVLAVGFDPKMPHRATGRVAWIRDGQYSRSWDADTSQMGTCKGVEHLRTTDDTDALVRWLRGEA